MLNNIQNIPSAKSNNPRERKDQEDDRSGNV